MDRLWTNHYYTQQVDLNRRKLKQQSKPKERDINRNVLSTLKNRINENQVLLNSINCEKVFEAH